MTPRRLGRKRKSENDEIVNRKITIQEQRDSFFLHVPVNFFSKRLLENDSYLGIKTLFVMITNIILHIFKTEAELDETIHKQKAKLLAQKLTFQPIAVYVGPLVKPVNFFVVVVTILNINVRIVWMLLTYCLKFFFCRLCIS